MGTELQGALVKSLLSVFLVRLWCWRVAAFIFGTELEEVVGIDFSA